MYHEEIAKRFADLLTAADEYSAPMFAADLAKHGATAESIRMMAGRWSEFEFEPPEFAGELESFAQDLVKIEAEAERVQGETTGGER